MLSGARRLIARARPLIFLELHRGCEDASREILRALDYRMHELADAGRFLAEPT